MGAGSYSWHHLLNRATPLRTNASRVRFNAYNLVYYGIRTDFLSSFVFRSRMVSCGGLFINIINEKTNVIHLIIYLYNSHLIYKISW